MKIDTIQAYEAARARMRQIAHAGEGTPEAAEMTELMAAVQAWEIRPVQGGVSSPGQFNTAQRPGQPGEQNEHRAGPSPRSVHPSGPHPPYDADDPEGTAAEKHHGGPTPAPVPMQDETARRTSGTIRIVDLKQR